MRRFRLLAVLGGLLLASVSIATIEVKAMSLPELNDSGIPQWESQALASIYADAAQRIRDTVINPKGRTEGARQFKRAWGAQKLLQLNDALDALRVQTADWLSVKTHPETGKPLESPVWRAVREGLVTADTQAREAGVRVEGQAAQGSFSLIDRGTVETFSRDIAADLYKAIGATGERAKRVLRETQQLDLSEKDVDQILATGVIEGKPRETVRRLRDALTAINGGTVVVPTKGGGTMSFDAGYYAEMVARTKTRQATVVSRHNRLERLGVNLVVVIGRVSPHFCTAFIGQIFSLDGKHPKYPAYASLPGGGPPFHPNCSKSTRPFVEELATPRQLERGELLEDAGKLLGMKPAEAQRAYKDLQIQEQVKGRYTRA